MTTLLSSTDIQHLGLSIGEGAVEILCFAEDLGYPDYPSPGDDPDDRYYRPEYVTIEQKFFSGLLYWLLKEFCAATSHLARLKSIHLGTGLVFYDIEKTHWSPRLDTDPVESPESRLLDGLLDLEVLEDVCAPDSSEVEAVNIGFVYPEVAIQRAQRLRIASLGIMEHSSRFKDTLCFSQELVRLVGFREDSLALRLGSTQDGPNVSHRAMGSHVYEGFALPGSPKTRKVASQFPTGTEFHEDVDKQQYLALRGCHWITTLAFQLVDEIPLEWLLGSIYDMLSTITNLEEL